jgi:hypothetical protein
MRVRYISAKGRREEMGPYIDSEAPFPSYHRASPSGICIYPPCRLKRVSRYAERFKEKVRNDTTVKSAEVRTSASRSRISDFRLPFLIEPITQLELYHAVRISPTMRCISSAMELDIRLISERSPDICGPTSRYSSPRLSHEIRPPVYTTSI